MYAAAREILDLSRHTMYVAHPIGYTDVEFLQLRQLVFSVLSDVITHKFLDEIKQLHHQKK